MQRQQPGIACRLRSGLRRWLDEMPRVLAGFTVLLYVLLAGTPAAQAQPVARQGAIDVESHDFDRSGPIQLNGEWGFHWGRFVDPSSPGPAPSFVKAPGPWNDLRADGKPDGALGHASYTLRVDCPVGRRLALQVPTQRTAFRLYVNGELAGNQGEPSADAAASRARVSHRSLLTQEYPCPMALVLHISSHEHRAGAFVRPISLGTAAQLAQARQDRAALDVGLLGAFCVMGLIPMIFFAARRQDPTPLLFGLFALSLALYADLTGERTLLRLLGDAHDEWPWSLYLSAEYVSWFAMMGLFAACTQRLFAREMSPRVLTGVLAVCGLLTVFVLVTPPLVFSHLAVPGQALALFIGAWVLWSVVRAARRRKPGARPYLVGTVVLMLVLLLDFLQYNAGRSTASFTPFGMMIFVLAPAVVLARRLARALGAEELRTLEQREKTDLLVRAAKAGILDWDVMADRTAYSPSLKEMLGHPADADTTGWPPFLDLVHPADRDDVHRVFVAHLRDRSVRSGEVRHPRREYRLRRADGSMTWVMSEAIGLTGSDGRTLRFIASFIDITERKLMEDKLRDSHDQIVHQADQLEQQNETLKENARLRDEVERIGRHDIKTPLNTVISVARLLRDTPALTAEDVERLSVIERAAYRILGMVNLTLDLFKMEQGSYVFRPGALDLRDLLGKLLQDLRAQADARGVGLEAEFPQGDATPRAWAEELLCYSMFANLVKNAIEASGAGDTVRLRVTASGDAQAPATPSLLSIAIHNPAAIPRAVRDQIFTKYATHGKAGGTGLGTYSARLMARVQDGDLTMRSSVAEGTTMTVTLRAAPVGAAAEADRLATATDAGSTANNLPSARLLLVDDDEYNLLMLRRYLPSPPLEVRTAVNGRLALDLVAQARPDLVVMDLDMPVMGGLEAVALMRQAEHREGLAPMKVLALSSHDDELTRAHALAAGFDAYLTKPVTRDGLLAMVGMLLRADGMPAAQPDPDKEHVGRVSEADAGRDAAGVQASAPELVEHDPDLSDAMPAFIASRLELLDLLLIALERDDVKEARSLAHRLAGGLEMYGFDWAAARCKEIERAAGQRPASELLAPARAVQRHLRQVRIKPAGGPGLS